LKPLPRVTGSVAQAFAEVESHATQGLPHLRSELPIALRDGLDQRPSELDELNDRIEEKLL
jgi:hypothetical protein